NNMDIKHFRAFDAVARHLHFTKAAEEQNVTQPTLSLLIQQLEAEMGVQLLTRSTRQVELTEMGTEFLPLARTVVRDLELAAAHMKDLARLKRGKVSVAAFPSVATNQLPSLIVAFRQKYPDIRIQLYDGVWETVIDRVRDGEADFAIASYPEEMGDLEFQPMYDDEIMLIVTKDHPLSTRSAVRWRELEGEEIVLLSKDTGVRRSIDKTLAGQGLELNAVFEPALIQTAAALVSAGAGVGVILSSYLPVIDRSNIVPLKLQEPLVLRPVGIITLSGRTLNPAAVVFKDMIAAKLSGQPAPLRRS
ncbi:MAG: LysR family transcriptional regulator, partial [Alphaproteobacteria bacterium]